MTKQELLDDIAKGRTVAQRLPLYAAAMQLGLVSTEDIRAELSNSKSVPASRAVTKKTATKKAAKTPVPNEGTNNNTEEGDTP